MKLRAILADDEPLARSRLRSLLAREPDVELVAECADGDAAVAAVRAHRPDVLFLDIQMPGRDGFGVLEALAGEPLPQVVFVTAYDQHALRAFEARALDYLLKPFKQSRLAETVVRLRERLAPRPGPAAAAAPRADLARQLRELLAEVRPPAPTLSRLAVKTHERVLFVRVPDIDYLESAGNYVVLHCGKENHVIRETMATLESQLPAGFLRISRSVIVNLDRVRELQAMAAGEHVVILRDGRSLAMTRGLRE
ncbi:MAG: LytR/AlgR family response regulator transcription factor, partial [Verrucomicrobiota bacterium]